MLAGMVRFNGKQIVGPSLKLMPGYSDIQLVNQDFNLDLYQTTSENIKGKILHLPHSIQTAFIEELLTLLELTPVKNNKVETLSGGEQQRLAIARALAMEPKVLLLDEPFVHIDNQLRLNLINYLLELKKVRKMSIIIVTHNSEELLSLADKIIYLKKGKIQRIGTPHDFYYKYKSVGEARMFGLINQLTINGKSIHFRPNEYQVDSSNSPDISVKFDRSIFMGGYFYNEFVTHNKKKIVLLHQSPLNNVRGIKIVKKKKATELE